MNNRKYNTNHYVVCESIEAHLDRFIAGLKTEGYASGSISTKRAALRRFLQWRRRRKLSGSEPNESEVVQFLARSSRLGPASIGHIVRHVMAQAEVERPKQIAAHLFRHTLASRMLQQAAHTQGDFGDPSSSESYQHGNLCQDRHEITS